MVKFPIDKTTIIRYNTYMNKVKAISTIEERDQILHDLYREKNFLVFTIGQDYFNEQVQNVHKNWINGIGPNASWGNNFDLDQAIWEIENL